jgi:calcineurin-like phosphoesterase family protein
LARCRSVWRVSAGLELGGKVAAFVIERGKADGSDPADWLIVAGDVCEDAKLFEEGLAWLARRFARVIWVPGNHELWLSDRDTVSAGSVRKYAALVDIARRLGVATPEDAFPVWPPTGEIIVPLFTLYDYSFRPDNVALSDVVS